MKHEVHPMQPVVMAADNVIRFKENQIVSALLDFATQHGHGLNSIAQADYSAEDYSQLMELIGYSVSAYGGLSRRDQSHADRADEVAARIIQELKESQQ